jgi:hypothetical protein
LSQRDNKLRHAGANKHTSPLRALRLGERRKHEIRHMFILDIQIIKEAAGSDLNGDR